MRLWGMRVIKIMGMALAAALIAAATGCAGREVITVRARYVECPRPSAPPYPALNPAEHVGGRKNVGAIMEIIDLQAGHIEVQGAALDCYETQAKVKTGENRHE